MNDLEQKFFQLKTEKKKALIPFFTCGYPDRETFLDLVKAAADSGADLIEIGLPFSDPLADGPSIQLSSALALRQGITVSESLRLVSSLAEQIDLPVVALTYANPIYQFGWKKFTQAAKESGVSGIIVADMVIEEADLIAKLCRSRSLSLIHLAAPTTNGSRLSAIAKGSSGFIYLVSVSGVTGARRELSDGIVTKIAQIKRLTETPVCVGFGISTPAQAKEISRAADGVIVGSAIVDLIRTSKNKSRMLKRVSGFLISLKRGMEN